MNPLSIFIVSSASFTDRDFLGDLEEVWPGFSLVQLRPRWLVEVVEPCGWLWGRVGRREPRALLSTNGSGETSLLLNLRMLRAELRDPGRDTADSSSECPDSLR